MRSSWACTALAMLLTLLAGCDREEPGAVPGREGGAAQERAGDNGASATGVVTVREVPAVKGSPAEWKDAGGTGRVGKGEGEVVEIPIGKAPPKAVP